MTRRRSPQCWQTERSIAPVRIANGMLIAMQSAVMGRLVLLSPTALVNEVLTNAALGQIIPIAPDEQEAQALLG